MHRVRLIHWNALEAEERAVTLRSGKYEVAHELPNVVSALREMRESPPSVVVIDLSRLPMQGRDVGLALRHYKPTRAVPLIFVAGDRQKIARVQQSLPDAVYTTWDQIRTALREAIANPPAVAVAPRSLLAGYSGTPLPKKLGIAPSAIVALVDAPPDFEKLLGDLPNGVKLRRQTKGKRNLTIWFTRSCKELQGHIERMALLAEQGPLWIAWPKKTSPLASDLTQAAVRKVGLATGLVDYKVCAIDAVWSGLLFTRRNAK
jgi:CheY-like chemotaxis protein